MNMNDSDPGNNFRHRRTWGPRPRYPQVVDELLGDIATARGQRDEARKDYERALGKLDQAAPTRPLLELKLIDAGGQPPAKPET